MRRSFVLLLLLWCLATIGLYGQDSAFDLTGPKIDVHVKRGGVTLPISEVPNLLPGDRLWIHPDLPVNQSAHFVLIIAFLRGATNPPPVDWFTRVETWNPGVRSEGVFAIVPSGAQQALLFLAPETSGDFDALRRAVRDLPGSFVRAAQDLQAASWDRMRLEAYLNAVKFTSLPDPQILKPRAERAARSLGIKINEACFDRPDEQQVSCLSQNSEGLVLDDANARSLVSQLTKGDTLNLVNAISNTSIGKGGAYSPYIGAIIDTARILSSMHTAHFRYIPALALPTADTLNLRLNMPLSFRNPKSVLVIALPPIMPSRAELLQSIGPGDEFCIQKPGMVLPASDAPLVFATHLAHDLILHIEGSYHQKGLPVDLPLVADPARGGLVLKHPAPPLPDGELVGIIRGKWGFDDWKGPTYLFRASQPGRWSLVSADDSSLVIGRDDTIHLAGQNTACVEDIEGQAKGLGFAKLLWASTSPNHLTVTVPMKDGAPGSVTLSIYQYGLDAPETISLQAYSVAASLKGLSLRAGDREAVMLGTRLDEVAKTVLEGTSWIPVSLTRIQDFDQLTMATSGSTAKLKPDRHYTATVYLFDGRKLSVPVTVAPPRPEVVLLNKGVQFDSTVQPASVVLGSPNDLPIQGHLVFFIKSTSPPQFSRGEKVEVGSVDSGFETTLDFAHGSLMLEDSSTAVATVDPLNSFGPSAFGPLRARVIATDGAAGKWFPLGTLVRLPKFNDLNCPSVLSQPCLLSGSNLFLAASFSATLDFADPIQVPLDFTGTELEVPHPINGALYIKLRDDPATVQTLNMQAIPVQTKTEHAPGSAVPDDEPAMASTRASSSVLRSSTQHGISSTKDEPSRQASQSTSAHPKAPRSGDRRLGRTGKYRSQRKNIVSSSFASGS